MFAEEQTSLPPQWSYVHLSGLLGASAFVVVAASRIILFWSVSNMALLILADLTLPLLLGTGAEEVNSFVQ